MNRRSFLKILGITPLVLGLSSSEDGLVVIPDWLRFHVDRDEVHEQYGFIGVCQELVPNSEIVAKDGILVWSKEPLATISASVVHMLGDDESVCGEYYWSGLNPDGVEEPKDFYRRRTWVYRGNDEMRGKSEEQYIDIFEEQYIDMTDCFVKGEIRGND